MAKFLARLFSGSSSSKGSSFRGSQTSINDTHRHTGAASNMRSASSLDNLSSYYINPKELEKSKIHKASWNGNLHKVGALARPGQIDSKDQYSRTPLHLAVAKGHLPIVEYLVHEGAKLDVTDNEKRTPLVKAVLCRNNNPQVQMQTCVILLNGGADAFINAVDNNGKNALHYAVEFGNEGLVDLFLSVPNCDPNFRDREQMTPLHLAVQQNNRNIVFLLLSDEHEQQANPNLTNRDGQTPLHIAANLGNSDVIRTLLQANLEEPCDPSIVDSRQLTPYQLALANNHETSVKLIDEYQQGWTKLSPRRDSPRISNEREINPSFTNQAGEYINENDESEETTSDSESQSSENSPDNIFPSSGQWPNRPAPSSDASKPENRSLADLIRSNPLYSETSKPIVPTSNNQTISSIVHQNVLPRDESITTKPFISNPKQPTSIFGIEPAPIHQKGTDNTSTSMSIGRSLIGANPIVQQPSSRKKNVTISALVNQLPQSDPITSSSNSWTQHTTSTRQQDPRIKSAQKVETWDDSSETESEDDDDTHRHQMNIPPPNTIKPQAFPTLNGTTIFTIPPPKDIQNDSSTEEDSVEAAIQQMNTSKPSLGIQNLVNKSIEGTYKFPQQTLSPSVQSPISGESSSATSSITQEKGINALVQQQPLGQRKSNGSVLDDSRPLSTDLKRNSAQIHHESSTASDDSDEDPDNKSATIIKSPLTNSALTSLVQNNLRPTEVPEPRATGVENLIKIFDSIIHTKPSIQTPSAPPSTISKLVIPPKIQHSNSFSSTASSSIDDTVAKMIKPYGITSPTTTTTTFKKQYLNNDETENWPPSSNDVHNFQNLERKYSNEMISKYSIPSNRMPLHHDINGLRGSMSSSTSSIQNNMERISELKEDIKQIERKQEDSLELKRQLKDMEIKKNNFEALYRKNDQLLHETEAKLERETNEKQRLELTTKNLNMELKNVKNRLQTFEEEKDVLNQRCFKLKEERDSFDERLRTHQANSLQSAAAAGVLREEDIEKIKARHREEMKLLSAENEDLHMRTKQLQSDLQLHKESLDVTIRYKIDLERALDEKTLLQHELDRLKYEKDFIEQEKTDYKTKCDNLQEEIRVISSDRSKYEQKLAGEVQENTKQRQRSTDDAKKYKTQIEQLNLKLGDAEARLLVLQTQNEALLVSKDREIKNGFESLTKRLNVIESEKLNAEQRYQNEHKEIANKQQQQRMLHEPLSILTSTPLSNGMQQQHQHSPSSPCTKCDTLQRSFEQEREQRLKTEKDNERLRDVVTRQKQQEELNKSLQHHHENERIRAEDSRQRHSETESVRNELNRLRQDFERLISNYEPQNNLQQQAQLHAQIDSMRQFYEQAFKQKILLPQITNGNQLTTPVNNSYRTYSPTRHDEYHHSQNGSFNCSICSNSRLLKERLANAIDSSLADQRIQTIRQMPIYRDKNHLY